MIELQTVTTKAKNPSTNEFQDVTWGGINVLSTSGTTNYNNLTNKPTINGVTVQGSLTTGDLLITAADVGALPSGTKYGADFALSIDSQTFVVTAQLKDQDGNNLGQAKTIDLPLETMVVSGSYDDTTQKIILTLKNGQTVEFSVADLVSGLQSEITLSNKLDADLVSDVSSENKFVTTAEKTAWNGKQDTISDLDTIRSGASAGATALQPEDIDTLPTYGSSNPVSSGGTYNFVNSSIATNTAYFIGTFASVAELEAYTGTVTNNDYAFVTSTDSAGNTLYNRYKYNSATQEWSFEYAVNNTAFTAAQWAAIQSGLTASDKTKLDGIETGANKTVIDATPTSGSSNAVSSGGVHTALSGKQDTIADLSDIRSGASAGATAVQPSALTDYQTKLSGTNKLDPAYIEYDASHRAVSDSEKSTWSSKQDAISDLDTIRSGAASGATALQQSDVSSTYSATGTAPVNGTAVNAAIGTLDVSSVGGSGKYISAISEANGKIAATETTMDTTPTANSTVPVTSGGVATDQTRQDTVIGIVENKGAKNLLEITRVSQTIDGVTFTVNDDDTVTIDTAGVASQNRVQFLLRSVTTYPGMQGCVLSGAVQNNQDVQLRFQLGANPWTVYASDSGSGATILSYSDASLIQVYINVPAGSTVSNLVFKPMICTKAEWDISHEYVPYGKTNAELTNENASQQSEIDYAVNTGVKNLIKLNPNTYTSGNVVVKLNDDGTVSVYLSSGSVANTTFSRAIKTITNLRDMDLILNGCPSGGNYSSGYALYISDNGTSKEKDEGNGVLVPKNTTVTTSYLALIVRSGTAISGTLTFKPMLRPASITDRTFQPYALSNPVLTPAAIKAVDEGAKNLLNATSGVQSVGGFTLTPNGDGTYTVEGERTSTTTVWIPLGSISLTGNYFLSGAASNSCRLTATVNGVAQYDFGDGAELNGVISNDVYVNIPTSVSSLSGVIVKPMICTAADWAVSQKFVPYCPSLPEVYEGNLKTTSYNFASSLNSNIISINDSAFVIYKYGNVCMARVSLKVSGTLTGSDTISSTVVPVNYRPIADVYQSVTGRDQGSWTLSTLEEAAISVGTDGVVTLRTGTKASSTVYVIGTITWICA